MCKAFEEVRREGYNLGMEQGMQQEKISNIKSLMDSMGWSNQQAMDALRIPEEERPRYAAML